MSTNLKLQRTIAAKKHLNLHNLKINKNLDIDFLSWITVNQFSNNVGPSQIAYLKDHMLGSNL